MKNFSSKFLVFIFVGLFLFLQSFIIIPSAFSTDQPEPPGPPYLQKPVDPNYDGVYLVDWTDVECAASFKLQEADNPGFVNAANFNFPKGTTQTQFSKSVPATYYYRVKATSLSLPISKETNFLKKFFTWLTNQFSTPAYALSPCLSNQQANLNTNWSNVQSITIIKATSFIDGVVYQAGSETPVSGATITSPDFPGSATTSPDGKFSFSFQTLFPESGKLNVTINIAKDGFTQAQRVVEVVASRHAAAEPVYLTTLDPITTTITPSGGTHINSTAEIELIFPPGAVTEAVEVNSTKYQQGKALPNELPQTSFFTYALNLDAQTTALYRGEKKQVTTFQQPITMKVANTLGFAAGTPIPAGVYNEVTKQWEDTGLMGQISADGQWLEFQITHFSPWDLNLPAPPPPQDRNANVTKNNTQDITSKDLGCAKNCGNSQVGLKAGILYIDHQLPEIKRLNYSSGLTLSYNSLTAQPSNLISVDTDLDSVTTNVPATATFKTSIAGRQAQATYQGVSGKVRYAYLFDGKDSQGNFLPTGSHPYVIEVSNDYTNATYWTTSNFGGSPIANTGIVTIEPKSLTQKINGQLTINNQRSSPLGAGWNLQGLERLYIESDGSVLLTEGNGSSIVFKFRKQIYIPDLAVVNSSDRDVSILLGNADGTFLTKPDVPVGDGAFSIASADFNKDSISDLAVINTWNNNVSIFIANGDGTFTAKPNVPVGLYSTSLTAADFNKDAIPDLAVANSGSDNISVFLGNGDGTFLAKPNVPVGDYPSPIITADFNKDAIPDFAVANQQSNNVSILIGNGDGTFLAKPNVPVGVTASSITTADFNGDSIPDLAVANYDGISISILLGNGDGTFAVQPNAPAIYFPLSITTADFNGDSIPDLAVLSDVDRVLFVLLGNGDGTFFHKPKVSFGWYSRSIFVTTADFNGDSIPDLAVANKDDNDVSILLGNGVGIFIAKPDVPVGHPGAMATGDFNKDYFEEGYVAQNGDYSIIVQSGNGAYTRKMKDGTQINFNSEGLQTSVVDRNGNITYYQYTDANSDAKFEELSRVILPTGARYEFAYTPTGKLQSITDPAARVTQLTIDANNDLTQIKNPDNSTLNLAYDNHLLTNKTTERGFTTQYQYDNYGRVKKTFTPTNPQEERQYFPSDVQGLINDLAPGVGTPSNPAPVVRPDDITERVIDGKGYTTTSQTSKFGAYARITDALSQVTTIDRDVNNNPVKITRPNNSTVSMAYDAKGNLLTSTEDSIQATTVFTYEPNFNQVSSIQDPKSNLTTINYDSKGNPIQITDALGNIAKMEYNSRGQVTKTIAGFGTALENNTLFTYYSDTLNLQSITDSLNNTTTFTYDSAGNILVSTDANNKTTTFEYDLMGRLTKVTDPDNKVTQYQYDQAGNLKKIIDAKLHETNFTYDEINQLKTIANPLNKTKTFSYDLNRNLKTVTDFKNQTINFTYDEINRLTNKSGTGLNVTNTYDSVNNLTSTVDANSSLTLGYDLASRLTSSITANLGHQPATSMSFTFDKNSNRLTLTDPNSVITKYVYDALNRLTDITDASDVNIAHFGFDELSRRNALTLANGTSTAYGYDLANRLLNLTTTAPNSKLEILNPKQILNLKPQNKNRLVSSISHLESIFDFSTPAFAAAQTSLNATRSTLNAYSYTYDFVGNRLTMIDSFGTHTYGYDNLYRLTSSTLPSEAYAYDQVGNRNPATFVYDAANRLLDDGTYTYAYDDNGNLITKTNKSNPSDVTSYTYNIENQLIRVTGSSGNQVDYTYDGLGRRIEKNVNGTITRYVYDNEDIIAEYDGSNTLQAKYLHGSGIDEPLRMTRGGQNYFYHADGLGSIISITNSTGATVKTYRYDAFGNIISQTGTITNPYTYTGREFDAETGMYYYRARYYDARIGRFLQEDPARHIDGELNLYMYARNNPINFLDPWGLAGEKCKIKLYWPKWMEPFVPGYERYGGPMRSDPTFTTEPSDSMDALFRDHDIGWSEGRGREADKGLLEGLNRLPSDPKNWTKPAKNRWWGNFYRRNIAEPYFWWINRIGNK